MSPKFPIHKIWVEIDATGRTCIVEIKVEQTNNKATYPPDGIKSVFIVKRENRPGGEDFEAVLLIDNHAPFGFHEHPKLPSDHEFRETVHASSWVDAWDIFEKRIEELLDET